MRASSTASDEARLPLSLKTTLLSEDNEELVDRCRQPRRRPGCKGRRTPFALYWPSGSRQALQGSRHCSYEPNKTDLGACDLFS